MPTVSFEISTAFLTKMRAAIIAENPALQGQPVAVINEAARVKGRSLIRDWVHNRERSNAATNATAAVAYPTDADIL